MWFASLSLTGVFFVLLSLYTYFYNDQAYNLTALSQATASIAALMIGLSFAMSGLTYYFDFLDSKLAYRKYFGLAGYYLALLYIFSLLLLEPKRYFFGFFDNIVSADFLLGLSAMAILSFVALISNSWGIKKLGPHWRPSQRLGYLAYALLIVRAVVIEWDVWIEWWENFAGLPPPRLLISIFALLVILFRGSMIVPQFLRQKNTQSNTPNIT